LIGMIPLDKFFYLFSGREVTIGGAATANVWITGSLAMLSFLMIHIAGVREQGFIGYIRNFAPKVPLALVPFIYFMEIVSSLVRPFALAVRLFANILAGHILIATILGLIFIFRNIFMASASILAVVALSCLDLLVAFLQAYIFAFLSTIFISFAVASEH